MEAAESIGREERAASRASVDGRRGAAGFRFSIFFFEHSRFLQYPSFFVTPVWSSDIVDGILVYLQCKIDESGTRID